MSDKPTKQPAHEVILHKLEERVAELEEIAAAGPARTFLVPGPCYRALEVVGTLCDVLREMVIPEKEREKVLVRLQELAARWRPLIAGHTGLSLIEDLRVILSRE